jgi:hypothetical protein
MKSEKTIPLLELELKTLILKNLPLFISNEDTEMVSLLTKLLEVINEC